MMICIKYNEQLIENNTGYEGANKISESLKINTTLTVLDLSGNWNTSNW